MVINITNAVATIIQAVFPALINGAGTAAATGAAVAIACAKEKTGKNGEATNQQTSKYEIFIFHGNTLWFSNYLTSYNDSSPRSPVLILIDCSIWVTNILPSPLSPV